MVRRNYKLYSVLGLSNRRTVRQIFVLDTGAVSTLIKSELIISALWAHMLCGPGWDIAEAIKNPLRTF